MLFATTMQYEDFSMLLGYNFQDQCLCIHKKMKCRFDKLKKKKYDENSKKEIETKYFRCFRY